VPTAPVPGTPAADPKPTPLADHEPPAPVDPQKPDAPAPDGEKPPEPPADLDALTVPEGLAVEPATLDAFKATAKELGISPAQAQGLLAFYAKQAEATAGAMREAGNAAWAQLQEQWESALKADPTFAVPGIKQIRTEAKTQVMKGLASALTPDEMKLVQSTPFLGSHPVLWKLAHKLGALVAEDDMAGTMHAGNGVSSERERLRRMYPNSPEMFGG